MRAVGTESISWGYGLCNSGLFEEDSPVSIPFMNESGAWNRNDYFSDLFNDTTGVSESFISRQMREQRLKDMISLMREGI